MFTHKASHGGRVAAEVIAGVPGAEFDPRATPSVAYTDPHVAWMGVTELDARQQGIEYETAAIPWAVSGRALSLGSRMDRLGAARRADEAAVRRGDRRLLGAGIVGVGAPSWSLRPCTHSRWVRMSREHRPHDPAPSRR